MPRRFAMRPSIVVKRLIRNRQFKQFLDRSGTWTQDHNRAQLFPTDEAARKARNNFRLLDCDLYYLVGEEPSPSDFVLGLERL